MENCENPPFAPRPLPAFAFGGTMYQIFLRQFTPEGTLRAAEEMIPHLSELGIAVVYLCPMFEADPDPDPAHWSPRQIQSGLNNPRNPYRMNDYYRIDPEYGTLEDLRSFVKTAHRNGIRVMLDLVYLHCGPAADLLSMDPEFIQRDASGKPVLGPWRFPLLNFKSMKLREYLWDNMLYFVRECDVDGYRCDVGGSVPLDFWEEGRRRIDGIKKEFLMLNEDGGTQEQVRYAFETVYGWRAYPILKVMQNEMTPGEFRDGPARTGGLRIMWHTDNHDIASDAFEKRVERICSPALNDLSLALIFTLDGMPLLYNGQEIADDNRHSIWANHDHGHHLGINWRKALTARGKQRMEFVRMLIRLHREHPALADIGPIRFLKTDRDDAALAFIREKDGEKILCVFNFRKEKLSLKLDTGKTERTEWLFRTGASVRISPEGIDASLDPESCFAVQLF